MSDNIIQLNEAAIKGELKDLGKNGVEEPPMPFWNTKQMNSLMQNVTRVPAIGKATDQGIMTEALPQHLVMFPCMFRHLLKEIQFETAIIERYRRRETSIEEALIEMYLAGVSVRRVEDITEALWGTRVSSGTISALNQKAYENIEKWRCRKLSGNYCY